MKDTEKYLIHATIAADGVVERSDVVGAVFGQTEGLLGEELDLRDLQESSKVGRIDVAVESENGQSFGEVTVASSLDKVETAILGAALETIDRIGPCHASVEVTGIEDVRAAKRREVVERAKELIADGFEETNLASTDVLAEVRDAARVEGIVDYEGLPAGPRVGDSDAVIVVEGRADVLTLLAGGIKNAVAVEGTNVPDAVAELTQDRTVTAFLDGDRGGELILRELAQVGDVDYVAFAPPGESVEDLDRGAVFEALRGKVPYETLSGESNLREAVENVDPAGRRGRVGTDGSSSASDDAAGDHEEDTEPRTEHTDGSESGHEATLDDGAARESSGSRDTDPTENGETTATSVHVGRDDSDADDTGRDGTVREGEDDSERESEDGSERESEGDSELEGEDDSLDDEPRSLEEHVQEVIDAESGVARLLDDGLGVLSEDAVADAFDAVADASEPPHTVVMDGEIDQRLLDVAAQRGVNELFGRRVGEFVKRPIGTRVRTVGDLRAEA
ncbi:DNA primase DnaG [Halorubrum sp. DTA98]|uniref:DNA primase DnaG n=1 Tax=Halorubrum sp. DTA98 TaxID=3402163 RepID=UPI003AB014D2